MIRGGGLANFSGQMIYYQHELGRTICFKEYQGQNIYFNRNKILKKRGGGVRNVGLEGRQDRIFHVDIVAVCLKFI